MHPNGRSQAAGSLPGESASERRWRLYRAVVSDNQIARKVVVSGGFGVLTKVRFAKKIARVSCGLAIRVFAL